MRRWLVARRCFTLCLPIGKDDYAELIGDPGRFRPWLDQSFRCWPGLFPQAFSGGYRLKDVRSSARAGLRLRRLRLKATGESFSVRPSCFPNAAVAATKEAKTQ